MWSFVYYYTYETTKSVLWWSGGQMVYFVTPSMIYSWIYPQKTEVERLMDELRQVREELHELNKNGNVREEKDVVFPVTKEILHFQMDPK